MWHPRPTDSESQPGRVWRPPYVASTPNPILSRQPGRVRRHSRSLIPCATISFRRSRHAFPICSGRSWRSEFSRCSECSAAARRPGPDVEALVDRIIAGDRAALAQMFTILPSPVVADGEFPLHPKLRDGSTRTMCCRMPGCGPWTGSVTFLRTPPVRRSSGSGLSSARR